MQIFVNSPNISSDIETALLYNNDDLNVAGLPSSPLVSSGELSSSRDSYLLAWHTTSFTDILQYQVLYRRLPVSSMVFFHLPTSRHHLESQVR